MGIVHQLVLKPASLLQTTALCQKDSCLVLSEYGSFFTPPVTSCQLPQIGPAGLGTATLKNKPLTSTHAHVILKF